MRDLKDETIGTKAVLSGSASGPSTAASRRRSRPTPLPIRLRRAGRLMGFCFVASAAIGLLALRSVYADMEKAALGVGNELEKVGELGEARNVRLNGQSVHVASTMDPRGVTAVLDDAEKACEHGGAVLAGILENLHPEAKKQLPADGPGTKAAGVLRKEAIGEGVVACLVRDGETASPGAAEMARRMSTMVTTGELAAVGKLRYVFARGNAEGKTHVVAAWTDGSFNLKALVPENGDTPGTDAPNVYRPEGSVRLLTADVEGQPYALRLYDSPGRSGDVIKRYDDEMSREGWRVIAPDDGGPDDARAYQKNGRDITVSVQPAGERTMVATIEMRSR